MYRACVICAVLLIAVAGFSQQATTIYEIQSNRNPETQASNWVGSLVTVEGIVTCNYGPINSRTFCLEMSQAGPWSGIYVYVPSALGTPPVPVNLGDSLQITGTVSEFYNNTELKVGDTSDIVRCGTTNLPPVSIISTAHLDTTATSSYLPDSAEAYEAVLVQVQDAFVTDEGDASNWEISDGDGYVFVRKHTYYSYTPALGDFLNVSGIVQTHYDLHKITPRMEDDIEVLGGGRLSVIYSTSRTGINLQFTKDVDASTAGNTSNYEVLPPLNITNATLDTENHSLVHLVTDNQTDALLCTLIVDGVQDIEGTPIYDTTTFYSGFVPIQAIQSDTVAGDPEYASHWEGKVISITGIITAETDCFPYDWYWVQQGEGPWSGLMAMHTGHPYPSVRGDSVVIACRILEYGGMTEIGTILYYNIESSGNPLPAPSIVNSRDLNVATGAAAEQWEGVLVRVDSATVVDAGTSPGSSTWYIDDGTGQCIVSNYDAYTYVPDSGDVVNVTGVIRYTGGNFYLYPRDDDDILILFHGIEESASRHFDIALLSNPVSFSSGVLLTIPEKSSIDLSVYNLAGQRVADIKRGVLEPGVYELTWDTKNIPNGIYFYHLKIGDINLVRKVVVLK
ncbi:MAG: T9SS type A sorting domain-containing protein [candidate division WOR-3 bacterium]|nr:T9SS type A sorting domain-containing protein [candidate division WOR-3 bacterium]